MKNIIAFVAGAQAASGGRRLLNWQNAVRLCLWQDHATKKQRQFCLRPKAKEMDTLERFKEHLSTKGASAEQIEDVCCDMPPAFYPWNP
ncbi:hypothetical protein J14TS5_57010 [Paenibacillus lautus]|uniref:hypothetical protein n=1 Tax=Paenibacillus lautus TaxID=1401 RepID=UPI001B277A84|nr:hypothetical protein [Paenibacillus lautus]GIP00616.1 hypothetical protein J14TS5_57010 [Paenibacillus lautus]